MTTYYQHDYSVIHAPWMNHNRIPGLAAIEAIYSNSMVKEKLGQEHASHKKKALAWQTYHWGRSLLRKGDFLGGAMTMLSSFVHDPSRLLHWCAFPVRRVKMMMDRREIGKAPKPD